MDRDAMVAPVESALGRVNQRMAERAREGALRTLTPRSCNARLIDLSNNDYLRLASHPEVIAAGQAALERWGASASASPLISGYTADHASLEARLCEWAGFAHGLIWNTGHSANQAILSLLPQRGDLVLADRLIHQSMISGILRSGARLRRYRHRDLDHLETLLGGVRDRRQIFVVTESVFSMDGDYPDLAAMARLKERYGFLWIVDEAHALGWYGERGSGLVEACGVAEQVDVFVGTLGKALGSMGAFTLFRQACLRDFFVNFAGEFIYSTYLAPACAAVAKVAVDLIEERTNRLAWQSRSRDLRQAIQAVGGDSPIIPLITGSNEHTMRAAAQLRVRGFAVGAVRPPTVPAGEGRIRISLNTALTTDDESALIAAVKEVG